MAQPVKKPVPAAEQAPQHDMVIALDRKAGGIALTIDGQQLQPDVIDIAMAKIDMAIRKRFQR